MLFPAYSCDYRIYPFAPLRIDPPNCCPGYDTKPSDGEASVMELWGMWNNVSLTSVPGRLRVVVSVMAPSMGQIEQFNDLEYLKSFNCVQIND